MNYIFYECTNLKYLDISNFNITNVVGRITLPFYNCEKLEYINFKNFKEGNGNNLSQILEGVPDNLTYCINNIDNMPKILEELNNKNCSINDCSDDWNIKIKLIIEEKPSDFGGADIESIADQVVDAFRLPQLQVVPLAGSNELLQPAV